MKKLWMIGISLLMAGCVTVGEKGKKVEGPIEGVVGRPLRSYSMTIDTEYDPRLDDLVAGYKLLPVTIQNRHLSGIPMDVEKDRWMVVTEKGKKVEAINSLKLRDPILWRSLPKSLRSAIDYPEVIPINYTATFDLIFPSKINIRYFSEIRYYNAALNKEFILKKED